MQVERGHGVTRESSGERVSNAWVICPEAGDSLAKVRVIPHTHGGTAVLPCKGWDLRTSHFRMSPRPIS